MDNRTHFVITGHIDHGKSTFVGRLLLEMGAIPKDRFENLKMNTDQPRLEYSHLIDSLADEKAKGITIGVSQTIFSYKNNDYVFIDAPGHHEFLQNMITGASRADVAFLIVDICEGIKESTLRHLQMLSFLGISDIVVVVNKMDLVDYSETVFKKLLVELKNCFTQLSLPINSVIPISAYNSENLVSHSEKMPWYKGSIVTDMLCKKAESIRSHAIKNYLRFVVHDIYENTVVGELVSGQLEDGKSYIIHQNKLKIRVSIDGTHFRGEKIQSFTLKNAASFLKRGDIIISDGDKLRHSEHFNALLIWFGAENINTNNVLSLRLAKQEVEARISNILNLIDSSSLEIISASVGICKGSIIKCEIRANKKISFDDFKNDTQLGRFVILKDQIIAGAGKIC